MRYTFKVRMLTNANIKKYILTHKYYIMVFWLVKSFVAPRLNVALPY